jgi:hypothetical protein
VPPAWEERPPPPTHHHYPPRPFSAPHKESTPLQPR